MDSEARVTRRRAGILAGGLLAAAGLAYVGLADPRAPGFLIPPCPLHALTGWYCPGCGGVRMTHDLLHGDLAAALSDNAFLLLGGPALAAWLLVRHRRGRPVPVLPVLVTVAVAALAWAVLRNLPGFGLVPA
ncbi:DUF2752 domain-containing protein [uncultured Mycolicibacterium sp.]|uniref:DUF2752 domain-containing protein n=1 Tax=uncultured Mycolicibacterium sp. TaxID=2320817 RepID=UPI0026061828|nr:DUF2752 domain-containing protein [uncultured Mycolicibacterium sp.]